MLRNIKTLNIGQAWVFEKQILCIQIYTIWMEARYRYCIYYPIYLEWCLWCETL